MSDKTGHRFIRNRIFILVIFILTGVAISPEMLSPLTKEPITVIKAETGEGSSTVEQLNFQSVKGREIRVYIFKRGGPTTLIIGGIHGDEPSGVYLAQALVNELQCRLISDFKGQIVVIPLANPDGLAKKTRVNARGIDINRNFPTKDFHQGHFKKSFYPGNQAASEPETQVILQVASQFKPGLILTFHAEMGCVNYDGPAGDLAKVISARDGLPVRKDLGYRTPGSLGTYFGVERKIPTITLELIPKDNQWERHGKAILEAIGVVN